MNRFRQRLATISMLIAAQFSLTPLPALAQVSQMSLAIVGSQGGSVDTFARNWATDITARTGIEFEFIYRPELGREVELEAFPVDIADVIVSKDLSATGLDELYLPFTFTSMAEFASYAKDELTTSQMNNLEILAVVPSTAKVMVAQSAIDGPDDLIGKTLVDTGGLGDATIRALEGHAIEVFTQNFEEIISTDFSGDIVYSVPLSDLSEAADIFQPQGITMSQTYHQFEGIWLGIQRGSFDALPEDQMASVIEASAAAIEYEIAEINTQFSELSGSLESDGAAIHFPTMLQELFAAYGPDESNTNGCIPRREYRKMIYASCKCVQGNEPDECLP